MHSRSSSTTSSYHTAISVPNPQISAPLSPQNKRRVSIWDIIQSYAAPLVTVATSAPTVGVTPPVQRVRFPRDSVLLQQKAAVYAHGSVEEDSTESNPPPPSWTARDWGVKAAGRFPSDVSLDKPVQAEAGDVFSRLREMDSKKSTESILRVDLTEVDVRKARAFPVRALVSILPSAISLTSLVLVLLVLLSPTVILSRSTALLDVQLDTNRTLSLGPLGSCLTNTALPRVNATSCTSPSLTPVFFALYTSLALPTSTLPFSFPLLPTALVLVLALEGTALTLITMASLPQRGHEVTLATIVRRKSLAIHGVLVQLLAVLLGLGSTVSQRVVLGPAAATVAVRFGSAFDLLWVAWGLGLVGGCGALALAIGKEKL